jgi:hypothetical protein
MAQQDGAGDGGNQAGSGSGGNPVGAPRAVGRPGGPDVELNPTGDANGRSTPDENAQSAGMGDGPGTGPRQGGPGSDGAGSTDGAQGDGVLPSGVGAGRPTRVTSSSGIPASVRAYIRRYLESVQASGSD